MNDELIGWLVALVWVGFFCWDLGQGIHSGSYHAITLLARWQSVFGAGGIVAWLEHPESWQWLRPIVRAYFLLPASVGAGLVFFLGYQAIFGRRGG